METVIEYMQAKISNSLKDLPVSSLPESDISWYEFYSAHITHTEMLVLNKIQSRMGNLVYNLWLQATIMSTGYYRMDLVANKLVVRESVR